MKRLLIILWLSLLVGSCITSFFSCAITSTRITASEPPTIIEFAAHPTTIALGKSTTLAWNVTNATSVQIDKDVGSRLPLAGTVTVSPRYTTLYILTASNSAGSNYASVTIKVTSPSSIPLEPD